MYNLIASIPNICKFFFSMYTLLLQKLVSSFQPHFILVYVNYYSHLLSSVYISPFNLLVFHVPFQKCWLQSVVHSPNFRFFIIYSPVYPFLLQLVTIFQLFLIYSPVFLIIYIYIYRMSRWMVPQTCTENALQYHSENLDIQIMASSLQS